MSHNALQSKVSASRLQRGASGERKTTEALARLHSARSFNHSHCFTAEGWGSSLTPLGLRSSLVLFFEKGKKVLDKKRISFYDVFIG